ncbi:hypothetical protein K439DRAFT_1362936 [Ramaria rubella]|nr:hypothetical protein K439DRAFT_1362936 [Ramaria rubella]
MAKIDPTTPSSHFCKLADSISRPHATLLVQLQTGHIPLAKYLHHIHKLPSPLCPICHTVEETVFHFIMRCPGYSHQHTALRLKLSRDAFTLSKLLSEPNTVPHLIQYVYATGRLHTTTSFGNLQADRAQATNP